MKKMVRKNEGGRSMVEMLGVLSIIGVLSVSALAGYNKVMAKQKINKTIDQISTIIKNTRLAFVNTQNEAAPYAALDMKAAVALNIFPKEMVVNSRVPTIINLYHGDVMLFTDDEGASFKLVFEGLPMDAAVAIGSTDWGVEDKNTGLQEISINDDKLSPLDN